MYLTKVTVVSFENAKNMAHGALGFNICGAWQSLHENSYLVCLFVLRFYAQSTQWGHVERGKFT